MNSLVSLYGTILSVLWDFRLLIAAGFVYLVYREVAVLNRHVRTHSLLMSLVFFLIITSYWILKPLKKAMFLEYYSVNEFTFMGSVFNAAQAELFAKEVNVILAVFAAIIFSLLARKFRRQQFFLTLIGFFSIFFMLLSFLSGSINAASAWIFYLSGDLFITMIVAGFYAFLNDSEMPDAAKRLYGLIGLGGTLGGVVGSSIVAGHAKGLSAETGLVYASVLIAVMIVPALLAGRIVNRYPPFIHTPPEAEPRLHGRFAKMFNGIDVVTRSRYLMGIAAVVGLYEVVSTLVDYQFTATIVHYIKTENLGDAFARIFTITNLVAVMVQLLVTRRVLTRAGVGIALSILPLAIMMGSAAYMIFPVLLFGALLNTFDNGLAYSLNQSAKEILYVPVSASEKYRAKAFIDIFVLRAAKGAAVVLGIFISLWFVKFSDIRWLSIWVMLLLALWLLIVFYLSKAYKLRESQA